MSVLDDEDEDCNNDGNQGDEPDLFAESFEGVEGFGLFWTKWVERLSWRADHRWKRTPTDVAV